MCTKVVWTIFSFMTSLLALNTQSSENDIVVYLFHSYGFPIYCDQVRSFEFVSKSSTHGDESSYIPAGCSVSNYTDITLWHMRIHGVVMKNQVVDGFRWANRLEMNKDILMYRNLTPSYQMERLRHFFTPLIHNATVHINVPADMTRDGISVSHTLSTDLDGVFDLYLTADLPPYVSSSSAGAFNFNVKVDNVSQEGQVTLMEREGVIVVADVDETLKYFGTMGLDALYYMFFLPYVPIPGMPELMNRMSNISNYSVDFYYLSASPWTLVPSIEKFIHDTPYPNGTIAVNPLNLFAIKHQLQYITKFLRMGSRKIQHLKKLMKELPERKYILLGDSAISDPEAYTAVMLEHPEQVSLIMIREAQMTPLLKFRNRQSRFRKKLKHGLERRIVSFSDPNTVMNLDFAQYVQNTTFINDNK